MDTDPPLPSAQVSLPAPDGDRPLRRSWAQRLTIAGIVVAAFSCFVAGSVLYAAQRVVEDRNIVVINASSDTPVDEADPTFSSTAPADGGDDGVERPDASVAPVETFPPAEPPAKNFLITGADNNSCVDPDSPYAGGVRRPHRIRRAQRHDHDVAGQPGHVPGRRPVVSPRSVGHHRRSLQPSSGSTSPTSATNRND